VYLTTQRAQAEADAAAKAQLAESKGLCESARSSAARLVATAEEDEAKAEVDEAAAAAAAKTAAASKAKALASRAAAATAAAAREAAEAAHAVRVACAIEGGLDVGETVAMPTAPPAGVNDVIRATRRGSLPSRLGRICEAIGMEPGPSLPDTARGAAAALGITLVDRGLVDKVAQLEQHLKLC